MSILSKVNTIEPPYNTVYYDIDGLIQKKCNSNALAMELCLFALTHSGRVTHICVSKLTIIGSDNGLLPCQHQAIIWTNAGILLIRSLGTNFNEISIEIHIFSLKNIYLKMLFEKRGPFCLGRNVLKTSIWYFIRHNNDKRRIWMRLWNHKWHPYLTVVCLAWVFWRKIMVLLGSLIVVCLCCAQV